MTRRDWWLGVAVIVAALIGHALFPRYAWSTATGIVMIRIDRWTGTTAIVTPSARYPPPASGTFKPGDLAPEGR